jgi:hypothetical protein
MVWIGQQLRRTYREIRCGRLDPGPSLTECLLENRCNYGIGTTNYSISPFIIIITAHLEQSAAGGLARDLLCQCTRHRLSRADPDTGD